MRVVRSGFLRNAISGGHKSACMRFEGTTRGLGKWRPQDTGSALCAFGGDRRGAVPTTCADDLAESLFIDLRNIKAATYK